MRGAALLLALWAGVLASAAADDPIRRALLSSAATIYSNGQLEWRSWSWGLSYLNLRDASAPMQGSREAMCLGVMPFGALSLRSAMPFALKGALGLYMRAASNTTAAAALGGLELQFESSAPGVYSLTPSLTLAEILRSGTADASAAAGAAALADMAAGRWVPVKVPLSAFRLEKQPDFKANRLTIGQCLQRLDGCSAGQPALDLCLDKVVLVG